MYYHRLYVRVGSEKMDEIVKYQRANLYEHLSEALQELINIGLDNATQDRSSR